MRIMAGSSEIIISLLLITLQVSLAQHSKENCVDFEPCRCSYPEGPENVDVTCQHVDPSVVYEIFHRSINNNKRLHSFYYYLNYNTFNESNYVPADLLGSVSVSQWMHLSLYPNQSAAIHPDAFTSSVLYLKKLRIAGGSSKKRFSTWEFLRHFISLQRLQIEELSLPYIETMPLASTKVTAFSVRFCNELTDFPHVPSTLTNLTIFYSPSVNDQVMSRILRKVVTGAKKSLEKIKLEKLYSLSKVPQELSEFENLSEINFFIDTNVGLTVPQNTFFGNFIARKTVNLRCKDAVLYVEPDAFLGNGYSNGVFNFECPLSSFEESAFKNLLQTMFNSDRAHGYVSLYSPHSLITCDCHLAWLVVENRNLLPYVRDGRCSNGTLFEKLHPEELTSCNGTTAHQLFELEVMTRNVQPCTMNNYKNNYLTVECDGVDPIEIQEIFSRAEAPKAIRTFTFKTNASSSIVFPAELFGGTIITHEINIDARSETESTFFFHRDTFASSKVHVKSFRFRGLWSRLDSDAPYSVDDWSFLMDFENLDQLEILHIGNMTSFSTLSSLPSHLSLLKMDGVGYLDKFPEVPLSLHSVSLTKLNNVEEDALTEIIRTIAKANASIEVFTLVDINCKLPKEIGCFQAVKTLTLGTSQSNVTSPAFYMADRETTRDVHFIGNNISFIEPNALQGYFGNTRIVIEKSRFETLEETVFKKVLEHMYESSRGELWTLGNYFICDCRIAWLVRDRRHLLPHINFATCLNGAFFESLNPEEFADC